MVQRPMKNNLSSTHCLDCLSAIVSSEDVLPAVVRRFDERLEVDLMVQIASEYPVDERGPIRSAKPSSTESFIERQCKQSTEWLRIDWLIKLGDVQSIEQLLDGDVYSVCAGGAVDVHSVLEAAVRNNQRETASAIAIKIGNRLHRHCDADG